MINCKCCIGRCFVMTLLPGCNSIHSHHWINMYAYNYCKILYVSQLECNSYMRSEKAQSYSWTDSIADGWRVLEMRTVILPRFNCIFHKRIISIHAMMTMKDKVCFNLVFKLLLKLIFDEVYTLSFSHENW